MSDYLILLCLALFCITLSYHTIIMIHIISSLEYSLRIGLQTAMTGSQSLRLSVWLKARLSDCLYQFVRLTDSLYPPLKEHSLLVCRCRLPTYMHKGRQKTATLEEAQLEVDPGVSIAMVFFIRGMKGGGTVPQSRCGV